MLEELTGLTGLMGIGGSSPSFPSVSYIVCSLTHSLIASSNFEALNRVDRYGIPAMVLSVSKTFLVMRTYTSLQVSRSSRNRPSMIAISPPVPVPMIKSKWSAGLGIWSRLGALPSISTYVRYINSWRIMSIEYPRTPPPSVRLSAAVATSDNSKRGYLPSVNIRRGGPLVVSFRRIPLLSILENGVCESSGRSREGRSCILLDVLMRGPTRQEVALVCAAPAWRQGPNSTSDVKCHRS